MKTISPSDLHVGMTLRRNATQEDATVVHIDPRGGLLFYVSLISEGGRVVRTRSTSIHLDGSPRRTGYSIPDGPALPALKTTVARLDAVEADIKTIKAGTADEGGFW